nr:immunoglobulin heavy chain junction region [Macaca mulatta]MOX38947.1 immunoglobulin heavy chain junction region [Macaca mulatta]MOX39266.1 immunoglobulin heavy chain junction region [Macaca mulatta]MOX39327.1 immunoglobulin heavy chain junction region [Macaca mulatta]MOX39477.1 immunoglobulin heavy chain junction region [Macaca mulatta]
CTLLSTSDYSPDVW